MKKLLVFISLSYPVTVLAQPSIRDGATLEVNAGFGTQIYASEGDFSRETPQGGLSLGIGGWLERRVALSLRVAMVTFSPESSSDPQTAEHYRRTLIYVGPSLQYWATDRLWFGAGLGASEYLWRGTNSRMWGADLRAGYTFAQQRTHAFDISVEVTPTYWPEVGLLSLGTSIEPITAISTNVMILAGYQYM